jgi:hypothetical protein
MRYNAGMSKITLFAEQAATTERWGSMAKSDEERLEELRRRQAQLKAKEMKILSLQKERERKADVRRKIIIGGIWLKYFPECKNINPGKEENFNGVVRAIATLANDEQFLNLWMKIKEASENNPAGPVES